MDDNDIHWCNDLSYINYHMKCLLYFRIDSKTSTIWFIIFASFVGCHPWHMLLIFEKEIMYVYYKKPQIQRNANNDNGRKHNKRPTKGKEQKFWGQFFIQKCKKGIFWSLLSWKLNKNYFKNKLWSCTLGSNGIKGTNHVTTIVNKVNWNTFVCWEVLNIVTTNC